MGNKSTDKEFADLLIKHIESPCVEPRTGLNIRDFYIREAKNAIGSFKDTKARDKLARYIRKYSDN